MWCFSTRRHTSVASNFSMSTFTLPWKNCIRLLEKAAPCISGGVLRKMSWPSAAAARSAWWNSDGTFSWVKKSVPPISAWKMSSDRHITPLGMPVVPPV